MPSARSASASSTVATPSSAAPASSAARPTWGAPWPYPSALTTAITWAVPACSRNNRTLYAIASRSTTASAVASGTRRRELGCLHCHVTPPMSESAARGRWPDYLHMNLIYEPIWAIGTGKTATTAQAQEMHAHLRSLLENRYGSLIAGNISILYGGSVKAGNATELFSCADVDGGLVGGASLISADFISIIKSLK